MAKIDVSFDVTKDEVVKTLTFAGRQFVEVWTDNGCCCENPITYQLEQSGLDLPKELIENVEDAFSAFGSGHDIVMSSLHELQEYETEMFLVQDGQ